MIPVYFPFSYISSKRLDQLLAFFPLLTVLQPTGRPAGPVLAEAARRGRVNLHFPPKEAADTIENLIREYGQWAHLRPKADLASFANLQGAALFPDDGSVSRITDRIRQTAAGLGQTAQTDPFLAYALFLGMAQAFDRQFETTGRHLQACRLAERQMLDRLTDAQDAVAEENAASDNNPASSIYMLQRRIEAWAGLYLHRPFPMPFFVTDTPAVMDQLTERYPGLLKKAIFPQPGTEKPETGRAADRDVLLSHIRALAAGTSEPAHDAPVTSHTGGEKPNGPLLTLYIGSGQPPNTFWAAFCPARKTLAATAGEMEKCPATVIGLIGE